jgi:plastocyanin
MKDRVKVATHPLSKKRAVPILTAILLLGLISLLVASCGGGGSSATTTTTPTTAGTSTTAGGTTTSAAGGNVTEVALQNIQIVPASITIKAGDTVKWTNKDSVTHQLVGDKGEFDSGPMAGGDTFSFTFDTPGTIAYHCTIHPSMVGTIVVQ